jgi:hypothetical protein
MPKFCYESSVPTFSFQKGGEGSAQTLLRTEAFLDENIATETCFCRSAHQFSTTMQRAGAPPVRRHFSHKREMLTYNLI